MPMQMLGNWFTACGFTRDDVKWAFGMIAAVVMCLATLGDTVVNYGIPVSWLPYIRLGALVIGIISGKMATSPLLGEKK